jgi:hypothetical protein
MANLITEKQKVAVKTDYILRLLSLSLLMCSLLGVFFLAYVLPYLFSINKKSSIITEQFDIMIAEKNKEKVKSGVLQIADQVADQSKAVEKYVRNNFEPSRYFSKIIESKNINIQISRLTFVSGTDSKRQFLIGGISKNREGLVEFIESLKAQSGFISVETPVSDFAKDDNFPFTLNVTIAI